MELILSAGWLAIVCWLIWRAFSQRSLLPLLEPAPPLPASEAPRVTVVVPVRNEAANIGACLDALRAQDYPPRCLRIVVVDDHSTDQTTAIVAAMARGGQREPPHAEDSAAARCSEDADARAEPAHDAAQVMAGGCGAQAPRLELISSPPLPAGWIGKSHACSIGAGASDGEWLCFLDADVRAEPALFSSAVRAAVGEGLDLLSLAPRQELQSFAERLILPCGLLLLAFRQDLRRSQAAEAADVTATGQFMLVRRGAYAAVGGHAAVRGEVCEDLELARLVKRRGLRVVLRGGAQLLVTRMYTGWCTLWPGLAKNLVDTLGGPAPTLATALAAVVLSWAAVIVPAVAAAGCAASARGACAGAALAGLASAAAFALHVASAAYFRIPPWYGLIFPIGYTVGALIALDSIRWRRSGRVDWKDRSYSLSADGTRRSASAQPGG
ncbi:MAG TPA: glycosyltransferase family A protein [Xanthobacteraceae bacterium]|jgi:chlorobactene glucosyltransferase